MKVTSNCAKKHWTLLDFYKSSPVCPHSFLSRQFHYIFLFHMWYNSSHFRTNCINFSSISEDTKALVASKHLKCSEGDVRLFTFSESSRYRRVRTRAVTSNILSQQRRRNDTETWRKRFFQCQHLRLNTHDKALLNGDVPRRHGNVTYSVNQPYVWSREAHGNRQTPREFVSSTQVRTVWTLFLSFRG
jgi:hypothetical protein